MKIKTLVLIIDLSSKYPARNGKSRLSCGMTSFLPFCTKLEADDRILVYQKDAINVCSSTGKSTAALMNYIEHKFKFTKALNECIDAALSLVEEDDIYVLSITDKYESWMDLDCDASCTKGLMKSINGRGFEVYIWSIGKVEPCIECPCVKAFNLKDISDLDLNNVIDGIFEANKGECPPDTMPGCFPLSV